jgi:hypothetical protein
MASKSINLSTFTSKLSSIKQGALKYLRLIVIVLVLGMYAFLVFKINLLVNSDPSDASVQDKLQTVQRPKIDQAAIDKIQQLQDNSGDVQTLFKAARDNPFQE